MYKLSACSELVRLQTEFQPGRLARSKASLFANQGVAGSRKAKPAKEQCG